MVDMLMKKSKRVEELESENAMISDEVCRVRHIAEQLETLNKAMFMDTRKILEKLTKLDGETSFLSRDINHFKRDVRIQLDYWNGLNEPIEPLFSGSDNHENF